MGETCLRAKALRRRRGGGVRGRHENGQRATMLTPLNTHQSKLQSAFSFAHLEQGLKAEGFQLLNPGSKKFRISKAGQKTMGRGVRLFVRL